MIFVVINQINKHKASISIYKKKFFLNIRIINLSLNELKLIAQSRNISDNESKSKKDLIEELSKPKPNIRIKINKKKLEEIRKDFYELRHKFSRKEADKYRKAFYVIKNYKHLSESEIKGTGKNLNELKKV